MPQDNRSSAAVVGLDLGDRTTHLCALDAEGEVLCRQRLRTTRDHFRELFSSRPSLRVVIEAGSQSPWIFAELTELGHDVHVADPRCVGPLLKSHRKTDRRDAESLARYEFGMPKVLGEVHHRTLEQQSQVAMVRARDLLVRMRTHCVQHVRGTLKVFGIRAPSCDSGCFHSRVLEVLPLSLEGALLGVIEQAKALTLQIRDYEKRLKKLAEEEVPTALRLQEVHGVGPLTSLAFVLTLADPTRFRRSRDVGSWVGLAPRVNASGDRDPDLPISKTGDRYLRRLLVQCAQFMLGKFGQDSDLRRYGLRLLERGGRGAKNRAVVAVARKLAVLLHKLWVSGEPYDPLRNSRAAA